MFEDTVKTQDVSQESMLKIASPPDISSRRARVAFLERDIRMGSGGELA